MKQYINETQWMFNLLVNGFDRSAVPAPSDKIKAYRQERLKRMVIQRLYSEFADAENRPGPRGAATV